MRYLLLLVLSILASAQVGRSQCAPNNPTGNFGFYPSTELLPCANRGVYYDETFYLENVDSFVIGGLGTIRVDTLRIDSIVNVPCNLKWITDKGDNIFGTGATGCIRVFGQTNDSVGQYKLKIYVTIVATIIGTIQGEINDIVSNFGPGNDFRYYIRVKELASNCPAIDFDNASLLLRTAAASCPIAGLINAQITGDTMLCSSTTGQLNLALTNVSNPAVEWSPALAVSNPFSSSTNIALTTGGYVTVVVTDTASTGGVYIDRVWVTIDTAAPIASANLAIINGRNIKLTSTSQNGGTYLWSFGDQTSGSGSVVLHTFAADGIYPISLTVSNSCGTDVHYDTLYIGNVGIANVSDSKLQYSLYPNPAQGTVQLSVSGLQPQEQYTIAVLDLSGKTVVQPQTLLYIPNSRTNITVEALQSGIYVFQIKSLHSSSFHKLIIY